MVICDINEFFEIANKKKDQLFSCQLNTLEFNPADYVINAPDFQIRSDPRGVSRDYDRTDIKSMLMQQERLLQNL